MNAYTSSSSLTAISVALEAAGSSTTSAWAWSATSSWVIGGLGKHVARHRANRDRRDSEPCLGHYRCRLLERSGIVSRAAAGYWSGPELYPGPLQIRSYARRGRGTRRQRRRRKPRT